MKVVSYIATEIAIWVARSYTQGIVSNKSTN